jgi:serine/threonine protein kinase
MVPSEPEARYPHTSVDQSGNEQYPSVARDKDAPLFVARTEILRDGAALPQGSRVQEFEIEELVGEGGFSIVYRARDTLLGRTVALKEYLPASLARRGAGQVVAPRSARHHTTFELGLRSFINEAQLLASFDHPSLVKVYRFWEENGTAYMVMPLYEGQTLIDWLRERNAPAGEAWLRALLAPLLDALELMHGNHCYHRDIAPDNVLLLDPARAKAGSTLAYDDAPHPVLLDFGAARRVIGDATQALTAILKPGFAPIEQYSESKHLRQGAWTDIYALCALLYHAVTGRKPMPSVGRLVHDELVPAATIAGARCSQAFLRAIDLGMAVKPQDRPQSVRELRALFDSTALEPTVILPVLPVEASVEIDALDSAPHADAELVAARAVKVEQPEQPEARTIVHVRRPATSPAEAQGKRFALAPIAAATVVAILAGAWYFSTQDSARAPASRPDVATAPAPAPAAAASAVPFNVLAALNDIVQGADPDVQLDVRSDKSTLRIGREPLRLHVRSSRAGYVYVYTGGTEKTHLYLLFPNRLDANNRIEAGTELTLPRPSWNITAGGPPGVNQIVVMVSRSPRDLSGTGIKAAGGDIPEFDLDEAARRWARRNSGSVSPFVGAVECRGAAGQFTCAEGYGARLLEVVEVAGS